MHDVEQRDVGNDRRQEGVLDDLRIRHADVLGHEEGGRAHHRRHDLAVDARGDLDGAGLLRGIAHPLHQGDGEGAAGHHVGDRRAGDHAHQPGRDHRGLGGAAAHVAEERERDLDEVVARPGLLQQRAEKDEQEDVARRNPQRHPEYPLGGQPVVRHRLDQGHALVRHDVGHEGAGESVAQHQQGDDGERRPDHPPGRLEEQQHADHRGADVERRGLAGTRRDLAVEKKEICAAERRDQGEHPILRRDAIARRALGEGKGEICEEQPDAEMQRAHLGRVQHENVEDERQRRGVPQLQQRPCEARPRQDALRKGPGGQPPPEVRFLDERPGVDVAGHLMRPFSL